MSIRLSSYQVIKIQEAVNRFNNFNLDESGYYRAHIPEHMLIEDLVEDIIKEALECPLVENKNGQLSASV